MTEALKKEIVQRIVKNLLDIQLLRLIQAEPTWGYKIIKRVEAEFGIRLRHGALYPLLKSLEEKGLIVGCKQREKGRTIKKYTITKDGRDYLETYMIALKEQIRGQDLSDEWAQKD